jgi:hypothetical protein
MVVALDERFDFAFEVAGQIVVFQQDAVLERLMPTLDFALGRKGRRGHGPYRVRRATGQAQPRCRRGHCPTTIEGGG